jgi:ABC-type polysaccharide/polyol phosphate export permease
VESIRADRVYEGVCHDPAAEASVVAELSSGGLFARTFLLRELVRRDFRGRYAGSLLGFAWSFVQPLWQLFLFSFVFSTVLKVSPVGERTDRFWVFLLAGLLPWLAIQEGVLRGATAVTDNANLVKKLRFPAEVLVLSAVIGALLHEAIAAAVFLAVLASLGELTPAGLPWLLVAVPLQLALTCGLALLLAGINVFFRDAAQILGMALTGWFYLTPIVFPEALVPARLQGFVVANPLTGLVRLYRAALIGGEPPGAVALTVVAVSAVVLLGAGLWVFRRLQPGFVDEI